jgi:hypothetical protein
MMEEISELGKMCVQPLVEYECQDDRHKEPDQCRRGKGRKVEYTRRGKQQKGGCGTR